MSNEPITELIVNVSTGEQTIRELTPEEVAERLAAAEALAAEQAAREAEAAAAKAEAEAKLSALGLTAEDLKAIMS